MSLEQDFNSALTFARTVVKENLPAFTRNPPLQENELIAEIEEIMSKIGNVELFSLFARNCPDATISSHSSTYREGIINTLAKELVIVVYKEFGLNTTISSELQDLPLS